MTKYTDDFKLQVIDHYLTGHSYKQTAQAFGIDHKQVEVWVKLYQTHGVDGIRCRKSKTVYSTKFKHQVVLQTLAGKSMTALAIELNIRHYVAPAQELPLKSSQTAAFICECSCLFKVLLICCPKILYFTPL